MSDGIDFKAVLRDLRSTRAKRNPAIAVAMWNNAFSVGQLVEYRSDPLAQPVGYKTRCRAEVLSGHTAVVWLQGKTGCVTLESCTPVERVPCDCLNVCGDDPWLKTGEALPCKNRVDALARRRENAAAPSLLEAARRLEARGFFSDSTCADEAAMRVALLNAAGGAVCV